jgi:hypothetical protein
MAPRPITGRTEDAEAPFLDAAFWKKGVRIVGFVDRSFQTQNGECYVVVLDEAVEIDGELEEKVSIGAMKGFQMALQAANYPKLHKGDLLVAECTGLTPPKKENHSPRVNFAVEITPGARREDPVPVDQWH